MLLLTLIITRALRLRLQLLRLNRKLITVSHVFYANQSQPSSRTRDDEQHRVLHKKITTILQVKHNSSNSSSSSKQYTFQKMKIKSAFH